MTCTACLEGELHAQRVTTWLRRGNQWVEVRGVRALVCDECGHEFFDQDAAEQLRRVADTANFVRLSHIAYHSVVDLGQEGNTVQPRQVEPGSDFGDEETPLLEVILGEVPAGLFSHETVATFQEVV